MSGLGGRAATAALAKFPVCGKEGALLIVSAMPAHVVPHQVEQVPGAGHAAPAAHPAECIPRLKRHAEALDRRLSLSRRCHKRILHQELVLSRELLLVLSHDL